MPGIIIISIVLGLFFLVLMKHINFCRSVLSVTHCQSVQAKPTSTKCVRRIQRLCLWHGKFIQTDKCLVTLFVLTHTQEMTHGDMPVSKSFREIEIVSIPSYWHDFLVLKLKPPLIFCSLGCARQCVSHS